MLTGTLPSLSPACWMLTPCVPSWSMIGKCSAHSPPQPPHTGETYIFSRNWQHQTNNFKIEFSGTMHHEHLFSWQCDHWRFWGKNKFFSSPLYLCPVFVGLMFKCWWCSSFVYHKMFHPTVNIVTVDPLTVSCLRCLDICLFTLHWWHVGDRRGIY